METVYKVCSFCGSVNHSTEYRLKASNFHNIRVEIMRNVDASAPYDPATNKHYTAVACLDCIASNTSVKAIVDAMLLAKANDEAALAEINK